MAINSETRNEKLYDFLKANGLDPIPKDSKNEITAIPKTDVFKFTYPADGKSDNVVWATIDNNNALTVYYDDETTDNNFFKFLNQMKKWAQRKQLEFKPKNRNHLDSDMAKREYMKQKEKLGESYYPVGKKASYSDSVPSVKILLMHTRNLEEGEQRFRNVAKIFVENTNGERFLVPTIRPGIARVYARHIAEGGTPYDERGKHITSLVEEYTKMAGFVRATKNGQFNESAQLLVNEGIGHYDNLRGTLQTMTTRRGYNNYFDSWSPVLNEEVDEENNLNELFVQETLDPRIESVMPILSRLRKNIKEMDEVKVLDNWAEQLINEKLSFDPKKKDEPSKQLDEEKRIYLVIKDNKAIGTWDGQQFKPFDRTKYPYGFSDQIPSGSMIDKSAGGVTPAQIGMAKIGLEEADVQYHHITVDGNSIFKTKDVRQAQDFVSAMKKADEFKNKKVELVSKSEFMSPVKEQGLNEPPQSAVDNIMSWFDTGDFDLSDDSEIDRAIDEYTNPENYEDDEEVPDFTEQEKDILFRKLKQEIQKEKGIKETGQFAGDYEIGEPAQWRNKGPKANKPAVRGDLVGESEMEKLKALSGIK